MYYVYIEESGHNILVFYFVLILQKLSFWICSRTLIKNLPIATAVYNLWKSLSIYRASTRPMDKMNVLQNCNKESEKVACSQIKYLNLLH